MKEHTKHLYIVQAVIHFLLLSVLVIIDQTSKFWVKTELADSDPIVIIPDVLKLQYHTNSGAVWGIMSGKTTFLIIFTSIVLLVIIFFYFKIPSGRRYTPLKIIIVFIMAGAIGNLIDRVILGHVVDFIYFELINFPLFNFADSCLTVSSILLFILALFYYKDADFAFLDQLFRRKKAVETNGKDNKIENDILKDDKIMVNAVDETSNSIISEEADIEDTAKTSDNTDNKNDSE